MPVLELAAGSFKCCDGQTTVNGKKNMKLVIKVTDANDCLNDAQDVICFSKIELGNGQDIGQIVYENDDKCTTVGGTITVYLLETDSCTVNLDVTYSVNGGPSAVANLKSTNISSGNAAGDCQP